VSNTGSTARHYLLWNEQRGDWCNYDIVGESFYGANIHRLLPDGWAGDGVEVRRTFELIPEPNNPHDSWAISVRADGQTVGYLPRDDCSLWANAIRRVVSSGLVPVVPGRIYAYETANWDDWDGESDPPKELAAKVQLKLGDPHGALPINDPPAVPYTLIPRSTIVQVTKEDEHSEALLKFVPDVGYGSLFVTLHECSASAKPVVEVRIDDERVGQLTPQMSQRFLPMIRHLEARGLVTACWGDIKGSAVAAEVRIDGIKANEAGSDVLEADPVIVPRLARPAVDPLHYDLAGGSQVALQPAEPQRYNPEVQPEVIGAPAAPPLPPPAWYDDPSNPTMFRYWDGLAWTQQVAPKVR
jgi:hypothetical protein